MVGTPENAARRQGQYRGAGLPPVRQQGLRLPAHRQAHIDVSACNAAAAKVR